MPGPKPVRGNGRPQPNRSRDLAAAARGRGDPRARAGHGGDPARAGAGRRPGRARPGGAPRRPAEPARSPHRHGAQKRARTLTIGWAGDVTPGSRYGLPAQGGRALFATVRRALREPDLMVANLEGTL